MNRSAQVLPFLLAFAPVTAALPWTTPRGAAEGTQATEPPARQDTAEPGGDARKCPQDAPLAPYRMRLLQTAYGAASAMPLNPHVKSRSRDQGKVVEACLALDQPRLALAWTEGIANWRRGAGYADYALYCVEHGCTDGVQQWLDRAKEVARTSEDAQKQEWRRDRILAKVAQVDLRIGNDDEAAEIEAGVAVSEVGRVQAVRAEQAGDDDYERQLKAVDAAEKIGEFEHVRNALEGCVRMHDRFYDDPGRRAALEAKVSGSWDRLPVQIRIDLLSELTETAIAHHDRAHARELVERTQAVLDGAKWTADTRVPLMARIAALRFRTGDTDGAKALAAQALALYESEREKIVDIYRADALIPLAEAFATMGDAPSARKTYARAIEEGVHNPNSRPRADDLTATCCSMALHAVEPDAELWGRIQRVFDALGDPW